MKWWPFFDFVIMANANIPFVSTLRKPQTQTLVGVPEGAVPGGGLVPVGWYPSMH